MSCYYYLCRKVFSKFLFFSKTESTSHSTGIRFGFKQALALKVRWKLTGGDMQQYVCRGYYFCNNYFLNRKLVNLNI